MLGALGGACAALVAIWVLGAHPGAVGHDLDALRRDLAAESIRTTTGLATLDRRVEELEARAASRPADTGARTAVAAVAADVVLLRDSLRMELMVVNAELERLSEIVDEVAGGIGGTDPTGPLPPDQEPRWVVLSADPEPGVRFSALVRLGRARTERSVQASLARLSDPSPEVVWQALRNLASFRDRESAPAIARLLGHDSAVVRSAAYDALLRLGAPADTGFQPVAPAAERDDPAARLRAWAEE